MRYRARAGTTVPVRATLGAVVLLVVITLAAVTSPAAGDPSTTSTRPVFRIADVFSGQQPTPVGSSTVVRTDRGASLTLETTALAAGDVVTLWWVVFNHPDNHPDHPDHPEGCQAGIPGVSSCGHPDAMAGRGGFSAVHGAGRIVEENGTAQYGTHLRVGDSSRALVGPGLLDARGAEIILVVKTHGPKIPRLASQQLRTFAGGCADQSDAPPGSRPDLIGEAGPNDCEEIQVSVHRPGS